MHTAVKTTASSPQLTLGSARTPLMVGGAGVGVVGTGAALAYSLLASEDGYQGFSFSYLVAFCFYASIALGGLFWVIVMHLTRAGWGVCVRRLSELISLFAIPMAVLFLPILIPVIMKSPATVFEWVNLDLLTANQDLIAHKAPYLNSGFFAIRAIVYFVVWGGMGWFFFKNSVSQDTSKDPATTLRMQFFSAPAIILFAASIVFSSFDWEMSLNPSWFSTMFPVYFFAGAVLGSLCVMILMATLLQRSGRLTEDITTEHYHDLSKLTFAFVFFWGYIAFSQYLLIWYANIPEETSWYLVRQQGGWATASIVLLVFHLLVPFLATMPRTLRRNKVYMSGAAIFLLVMHWFDHFWLIMPEHRTEFGLGVADICCALGLGGFFVASFAWAAKDNALIPAGDPRLYESLSYHNA